MDTRETYKKMWKKAIEAEPLAFKNFDPTKNVQDQLQEMILKSFPQDEQDSMNIMVVILDEFQNWVLNDCSGLDWSYSGRVSMEQLWLSYVMKVKYGKVWSGEDWVKES